MTGRLNVNLKITFGSVDLDGGLTAEEGLMLVDTPRTAGWLLGTGFGCGRTWFEVFCGSLLLLAAIVASVKQKQHLSPAQVTISICKSIP